GLRMLPQARRDELAEQALAFEDFLDLRSASEGFGRRQVGLDNIIVVELHAVEAEVLVLAALGRKGDLLAHRRPKGVGAHADVPGTEREAIGGLHQENSVAGSHKWPACGRK